MENASKALIIAGAILISILIIGLGVFIYNQAKGAIGNTGIDAQAAESNNQQFTAYFGNNKSAAEVKNLISLVRSYNINQNTSSGGYTIGFYFGKATTGSSGRTITKNFKTLSEISAEVKPGRTYTVGTPNESNTSQPEDSHHADTSEGPKPTGLDSSPAYYSNGFLRYILISE